MCQAQCEEGYGFFDPPAKKYDCGAGGQWSPEGSAPECYRESKTETGWESNRCCGRVLNELSGPVKNRGVFPFRDFSRLIISLLMLICDFIVVDLIFVVIVS